MDYKIVSYSFVGVWQKPILQIPLLDKKFCMDLFNDPYNTNTGMSNGGFVINYQGKTNPSPTVLIGPERIMFLSQELEQVLDLLEKIKAELLKVTNNNFPMKLKAYGINTEHEWVGLDMQSSSWLSKKFVIGGLNIKEKHKNYQVLTTDINFQIILDQNQKLVILLQPRANVPNGIFASINHHKDEILETLPEKDTLNELFKEEIALIKKDISNLILK
ncbi:MAG: hypothetical protein PWP52_707 [Bacteroidales bacterium]|jgi:hypothetical protein|nr:hypothetical protein [Bacteroidales bacterium]